MRSPSARGNAQKIQVDFTKSVGRVRVAMKLLPPGGIRRLDGNVIKLKFNRASQPSAQAAISSYRLTPNNQMVERPASISILCEQHLAFESATGLPLKLRAVESRKLAHEIPLALAKRLKQKIGLQHTNADNS